MLKKRINSESRSTKVLKESKATVRNNHFTNDVKHLYRTVQMYIEAQSKVYERT